MKHLKDVCMTYKTHALFSFNLSFLFLKASICAFIHAIFPFIFTKTSTEYVELIREDIRNSGCQPDMKLD